MENRRSAQTANLLEPFPSSCIPALGGKTRIPCTPPSEYAKMPIHAGKVKSVLSGDTLVMSSIRNPGAERILVRKAMSNGLLSPETIFEN
jgi:staphylococcal nuclease domain-containing protein 1